MIHGRIKSSNYQIEVILYLKIFKEFRMCIKLPTTFHVEVFVSRLYIS